MRTEYVLMARSNTSYDEVSRHRTAIEARRAAGHPDREDWTGTPFGVVVSRDEEWLITSEQIAETDSERVGLAINLLLKHGQTDGDHHKAWVIDQALRILTGDHYGQTVAEYCDGEDGPETYAWDEGIAP